MRHSIKFNDGWHFWKDTSDVNVQDGGEAVTLPHTWNAQDGQDGGNDYFRGTCVYKKMFRADEVPQAE